MKFLLSLTLITLFLINANAEIEGVDLKIIGKSCGESQLSIHPKEKIRFLDGMLAMYGSGESNDEKICTQVKLFYRLASAFSQTNDTRYEISSLINPAKREVCRDPVSDAILSDIKSTPADAALQLTATVNTKLNSGVLEFKGSVDCPQGTLRLIVEPK